LKRARILVVDDDVAIRDTVTQVLDLEGYSVVTAENGAQALQSIEDQKPFLVLLDMRMPIMDGWEFARELKTRGLKLPILVMTAANSASSWAAEIEADGFVAKPFGLTDLVAAVERFAA
jgi:CheY-like chemotaxis protein